MHIKKVQRNMKARKNGVHTCMHIVVVCDVGSITTYVRTDTRERKISASSRHFINFSDRALFHACHNKIIRGSVGPFNRKFQITKLPDLTLK